MIAESVAYVRGSAERALRFLSSEVRGMHAAVYILASAALLSSILALVRDRLLAHTFGASTSLDLYYAAFRIPDFIFVATGALVSVYILIPELARRGSQDQKSYIDTVVTNFSLFAIVVAGLAAWMAPWLLALLFPRFVESGYLVDLVELTRIMLLQPMLLGLSNILASITQARQRFALYALSPLLYNLGIMVGITLLYPVFGLAGLAWGVVVGALLHVAIQIPSVWSDGFLHRIPQFSETRAFFQTIATSVPRAMALSMNQVAFLGLASLAALLPSGSIAVFMFGFNLQAVPLAIIGASYSVAAFPTLASALSRGEREAFIEHVAIAARYVFFWSLPASALILVLRAHIVRVVLGSGAFDWTDTRLTAAAFALLALSLASQGLMLLLVRGYYAAGTTFVPFAISVVVALGTILLGFVSVGALAFETFRHQVEVFLRVEDIPGSAVLGLAFAYALMTIVGSLVMLAHFEYRFAGLVRKVRRSFAESIGAALIMGIAAYFMLNLLSAWFGTATTTIFLLSQGVLAGFAGALCGAAFYYIVGSREFMEVVASIMARLWGVPSQKPVAVAATAEEQPQA